MSSKHEKAAPAAKPLTPQRNPADKAAAPAKRVVEKSIHAQAFWLFSTIVALSIKEALSDTIPNLISPPANPAFDRSVYIVRGLIFLLVIIRFYLGSAIFFEKAHAGEGADEEFPNKSYVIDFMFGLIHFLLFFGWAFSIDIDKKPPTLFPFLLVVILLWDVPWLIFSLGRDPVELMKHWAAINCVTAGLGAVSYLVVRFLFNFRTWEEATTSAEMAAYIWVALVSVFDIWELIGRKEIIRKPFDWLGRLLSPRSKRDSAAADKK
jgi:hypothetical protein